MNRKPGIRLACGIVVKNESSPGGCPIARRNAEFVGLLVSADDVRGYLVAGDGLIFAAMVSKEAGAFDAAVIGICVLRVGQDRVGRLVHDVEVKLVRPWAIVANWPDRVT